MAVSRFVRGGVRRRSTPLMSPDSRSRPGLSSPGKCARRVLVRFYVRTAHSVPEINPTMEHELFRRLILSPSGGL
jgi:hypothetical protein